MSAHQAPPSPPVKDTGMGCHFLLQCMKVKSESEVTQSCLTLSSIQFLPFIEPIFACNVPLVSLFFLKRSLVFPTLFFFSISLHWSLRKAFLSLMLFFGTLHSNGYIFLFLLCLSLFFSQLFVMPPQTANLFFCISFCWRWSCFLSPILCH